jgi:hypothetical protein
MLNKVSGVSNRKSWTGGDYLAFYPISPFVLNGLVKPADFRVWIRHTEYLKVLLKDSITQQDIELLRVAIPRFHFLLC